MFQSHSLNVCLYRPVYQSMPDCQHLFSIISLFQVVHKTPRTFIEHRLRFHICRKMLQINFFNGKTCPTPQSISRNKTVFSQGRFRPSTAIRAVSTHRFKSLLTTASKEMFRKVSRNSFSLCYSFNSQRARHMSLENTGNILLSARDGLNIKLSSF